MSLQKALKSLSAALLIFMFLTIATVGNADGQAKNFTMEAEQHWETYGVGGTCIAGTQNLAVADVDDDGMREMITGGSMYYCDENGSRINQTAPLKIWTWNGKNLTLENAYNWFGRIGCLYTADADGNGKTEIITGGSLINESGSYPTLRIWAIDGTALTLKASYEGLTVTAVFVSDIDKDTKPEILTVGKTSGDIEPIAQISIWKYSENTLELWKSVNCGDSTNDSASAIHASDIDGDGNMEILTAGYSGGITNSSGQLRVWQWDGQTFVLKRNEEWRIVDGYALNVVGNPLGNTMAFNVKVEDVDSDGVREILAGGFTYDGQNVNGQLRIWNWNGQVLNLEATQEWLTLDITELKSIAIGDVDGDGTKEIVTSGDTSGYGSWAQNATNKERAELIVWSHNGTALTLEHDLNWIIGEGVGAWNCGTGDVDNDGVVEIVTVGCMYIDTLCDPDLRIWSVPQSQSLAFYPYLPYVAVGVTAAVIIAGLATFMLVKKKR